MGTASCTPKEFKLTNDDNNHAPSANIHGVKDRETEGLPYRQPPSPSILSGPEKILSILIITTMTFLGPASTSIYFPILNSLSRDLRVSSSQISLTITIYMITQALFPLLTASFSEQRGRRPVFIVCLTIYLSANIGLALQTSYGGLMALRCLQSFGGSSLSVVGIAYLSDILTRVERSKYRIYTSSGYTLSHLIGPVMGGLLAQFLGWRSVFWFLVIFATVMLLFIMVFLRESCRTLVDNGEVPPQHWNRALIDFLHPLKYRQDSPQPCTPWRTRGVLDTIRLLSHRSTCLLSIFSAVLLCGNMAVFVSIPVLFQDQYGFQLWQVGLTYVPYAVGGLTARWIVAPLTTKNKQRYRRINEAVDKSPQELPFERACLQVILPHVYMACVWIVVYGWLMKRHVHPAGPLIMLYFAGNAITGSNIGITGLLLATHRRRPAVVLAAANLVRFLWAAGAVAGIIPLIKTVGIGWTGTIMAGVYLIFSGLLWVVYFYGQRWRAIERKE